MARDLHDVVAGHVSAIAIRTGAALAGPAGHERETLEMARETSLRALAEMRTMIVLLRADDRAGGPVSAPGTLDDLAAVVVAHQGHGAVAALDDRAPRDLPAAVQQAALRIVQEALTNAAKHGAAGEVRVVLEPGDGALVVRIMNPLRDASHVGVPEPAAMPEHLGLPASPGTGLLGMRERAESLGGSLTAGPAGGVWSVQATIPASRPEEGAR